MNKQFLNFAFRNIRRNKSYSAVSILGLAFGMAVFFLILSFILFEMGFESSEKNAAKVYNLYWSDHNLGSFYGSSPYIFAKVFRANYSDVAECAQVSEEYDYGRLRISYDGKEMVPEKLFYAEPRIFNILTFEKSSGSIKNFSENINAVILSESAVHKYFNGDNVLNKIIHIKSGDKVENFIVSAIIKDRPANSQFRPDFIFNMSYFKSIMPPGFMEDWGVNNPITYFKLRNGTTREQLLSSVRNIQKDFMPDFRKKQYFDIISLKDVHLYSSHITDFFGQRGSIQKIYIFAFISVLILIMACINFINLNIARASQRTREIGIRKVLGAGREKLILQFTMESVLFSLIALPAALLLSELMAKYFYNILNCDIGSFPLFEHGFIFYLIAVPVVLGLLSGLYTAFYSVKKISAEDIQGNKVISTNSFTRRLLIGFQFLVFTGLLISSFIIYKQMQLMISDDLGYNRDNTLIVDIPHGDKYLNSVPAFIGELKNNNSIINASYTSSLPPSVGNTLYSRTNSSIDPQKKLDIQFITCDKNFIPTMGLKLIEGKNFGDPKNNTNEVIINELAVKKLDLKEPVLGKTIQFNGNKVHIIGVIRNFYSQSFYKPLMPLVLTNSSQYSSKIIIKYRQKNLDQAMTSVKKDWKNFFQNSILNITFSDKEFQKVYDNDLRFSKVIFLFTLIAIFISVIGLASLTSITAARRRKEIGIRKVMGASVAEVMILLGKEIFYISLIGTLLAWPLSFYFVGAWLDNYVYKTHLTVIYPLIAFLIGSLTAFAAISYQTFRAASANPVDSLHHE